MLFTEDTDRMKDITHLRSFAYDFYLREVQYFVGGRTSGLGPEYHLTGFLHDFVEHFFTEPVFARNSVHEGERQTVLVGTLFSLFLVVCAIFTELINLNYLMLLADLDFHHILSCGFPF